MNDMMKNNFFIQDWMNTVKQTLKLNYSNLKDEDIEEFMEDVIDKNIKVPIATLDNNYTHVSKDIDVLTLIQWARDKNFIFAGNGTIFKNQEQEYNPTIHMLMDLKNSRDAIKNSMKQKKPGTYEYLLDDMGQLNEKLLMNSDYGAAGSPITYFYNLYCAASTTATGQSLISTAMCTFEDFFSDNVRFIDFDDCSHYINNVINEKPDISGDFLDNKRADQVFERLKNKFIDYKENYGYPLFNMLLKLDQYTLNRLYYKNNLYEFSKLPIIKKLLFTITDKTSEFLDPNKLPKEIEDDLKELWTYYRNFVVYNYFAFNRIGRLTCDTRDTVCTIDTDSNMLTLSPWVDFMLDEVIQGDERILNKGSKNLVYMFINTICFIATNLIQLHLAKFAKRSGIPEKYAWRLNMKNEFLFFKMLLTDTKKRYMSKVLLREGKVFEKLDNKGVDHLKAECNDFTRDFITNLIATEVLENESETVNVKNVVNGVKELAKNVKDSLARGEKTFLTPKKAKEAAAYAKPFSEQQFRAAYAWNVIYPDQTIEFPDTIDIVHLNIPTLDTIEDIKDKYPKEYNNIKRYIFESKIDEVKKKGLMVLGIPQNINEIPEWCRPYINYEKIVLTNTSKMNPLIKSLGVNVIETTSTNKYYSNIVTF